MINCDLSTSLLNKNKFCIWLIEKYQQVDVGVSHLVLSVANPNYGIRHPLIKTMSLNFS